MTSENSSPPSTYSRIQRDVQAYEARGWHPIRVKPKSKAPVEPGWQNSHPTAADFRSDDNVGIMFGTKSGNVVDLDFDCPQARFLSRLKCFFGDLPSFRRQGLPEDQPGHRLVICRDAPDKKIEYGFTTKAEKASVSGIGLPKQMIMEIRAGGCQTVVPPSLIGGEKLVWNPGNFDPIPQMDWLTLETRAGLLAFCSFAAASYPDEGNRDNFCMHLGGVLIHAEVDVEDAEEIISAIAVWNSDTENRDGKARAALAKKEAGQPLTGLPVFLDFLGMKPCEQKLRKWLGLSGLSNGGANPPAGAIVVDNPDLDELTRQIEDLLLESEVKVYLRGSELVRSRILGQGKGSFGRATWRHKGAIELVRATPGWLAQKVSKYRKFHRRGRSGALSEVAPPYRLMALLHETAEERNFPPIIGLSLTPTIGREEPGYDANTGLVLEFQSGEFPRADMAPTRKDALAALDRLAGPLRRFPFADDSARSVALSAMISAVIRGELSTCPLHAFDAPAAGTGKSKLAEICGLLSTGVPPSGISWSMSEEENEKRLIALFRSGSQVVMIDNVTSYLEGNNLCTALTHETIQGRILGSSEVVTLPTRTLILATGNNLVLRGDLCRRSLLCRLDAKMSHPKDRMFNFDPVSEVRENRAQLVVDALTVVRAYLTAEAPRQLPAFGSFDEWSRLVRAPLVWLGQADPCESRAEIRANDPIAEERAEVLCALLRKYEIETKFRISDIDESLKSELARHLRDAAWNSRRAGRLLTRHKDLPYLGVVLRCRPSGSGVQEYWIEGEPELALAAEIRRESPM